SWEGQPRHPPYQIFYGVLRSVGGFAKTFAEQRPNPAFAAKMERDLAVTSLIVLPADADPSAIPARIPQEIAISFTKTPPLCARDYVPIPHLILYFRIP